MVRAIHASLYEIPASTKSSSALILAELQTLLDEGGPSEIAADAAKVAACAADSPLDELIVPSVVDADG
jgi:hypothetical protein